MNFQYYIPFAATQPDGAVKFGGAFAVEEQPITTPEQVVAMTQQLASENGFSDVTILNIVLLSQFVVIRDAQAEAQPEQTGAPI